MLSYVGELKLRSSRLSIRPAMFDLADGAERGLGKVRYLKRSPLVLFYRRSPSWYNFLSSPGLPQKSKVAAIITRHSPAKITPFETYHSLKDRGQGLQITLTKNALHTVAIIYVLGSLSVEDRRNVTNECVFK